MSDVAVMQIVEPKLDSFWNDRTALVFDDQRYISKNGVSFARCFIEHVFSETKSMKCQRETHLMTVQVFTPANDGTFVNKTNCDSIIAEFFGYSDGQLIVTGGRSERVGNEKEWYRRDVLIDIQYDQIF